MISTVHQLIYNSAKRTPNAPALVHKDKQFNYAQLQQYIENIANSFQHLSLQPADRIGIYLPKNFENVGCMFACSIVSAVFVPINPVLKAPQVQHIMDDCTVKVLITNKARYLSLVSYFSDFTTSNKLSELTHIVITDIDDASDYNNKDVTVYSWQDFLTLEQSNINNINSNELKQNAIDNQKHKEKEPSKSIAAILYTSGSTGKPKGVVVTQSNLIVGAQSVSQYLNNTPDDRLLALLPLSFDYGLSQLTTSFLVGARCILLDYLLPNDVLKAIKKHKITGVAAVPPLWHQLAKLTWPNDCGESVRYFTNSGGALSVNIVNTLRQLMPKAAPYLMYGLTEAFRSTYLAPEEIDIRVNSIGKAVPNANVYVLNAEGNECGPNEPGELVHSGPLVTLGYWNDIAKTQQRFKLLSPAITGLSSNTVAVFSGDTVTKDEDGYLYFVARNDEMIKTSGYRVSPTEIEEVLYQHSDVIEVAVLGIKDEQLGQAVVALISSQSSFDTKLLERSIIKHCQQYLANYLVPKKICFLAELPHNANGKIDRNQLHLTYQTLLTS